MATQAGNEKIMSDTRWKEIYEFVLSCTSVFEQYKFGEALLREVGKYIPYDEGTIYYINGNGKIKAQFFTGNEKEKSKKNAWFNIYEQYYSKLEGFAFPETILESDPQFKGKNVFIRDWFNEPRSEFKDDYIAPRHICYSMSMFFFSTLGACRMIIMMDRTSDYPYTSSEIAFMQTAYPLLNNFHKNMFGEKRAEESATKLNLNAFGLTSRETQIANLLCHGFNPENIAKKIHISLSTTYKHIAHIYKKMQVTSRQEFLVKVLQK